ncbi:hypothetical protein FGG08_001656 [Glutinoglossum americanum]|uniref:glucan endo-1,3-beta-D-glucosidase n=1 Tax=Glutinoglossum americanum TaxID=1670608 RepID=A0A9P8ID97_9PEZI|nr:hypothetical protein FGG08_001656 [Glutinoglossum americanum]
MRQFLAAGAVIAASIPVVLGKTSQELCAGSSQQIGGNYYCKAVSAITYTGVGSSGSYNAVTSMDPTTGQCASTPRSYSGQLAPLCDEVAMHIRGPVHLKQFAVYYQNPSSSSKRKRHGHQHLHKRGGEVQEKRDYITATINGEVVSWPNPNSPGSPQTAAAAAASSIPAQGNSISPGDSTGDWLRAGYYNAASATLANLTFLNNMGGQGSGTFDYDSGASGMNADMPAIWMLNAQIGRTLQYGKPECSCWTTGCGEFDLFEVLDAGNNRCKSTLHMGSHSAGDSNYFQRPTGDCIKAAVLFDGPSNSVSIQVLDPSTAISGSLTNAQVAAMWKQFALDSDKISVFQMP